MNILEQTQAENDRLRREIKQALLTEDPDRVEEVIKQLMYDSKRRLHEMTSKLLTPQAQ